MVGSLSINSVPGVQNPTIDPNSQTPSQTQTSDQTTGAGNLASSTNGSVPDVAQAATQTGKVAVVQGFQIMMQSLSALMPKMSSDDQDALVAAIASKLKEAQTKGQSDKINADEKVKQAEFAEQKKQLDDAAKKIQDAINEMSGPFGWLKRIFSAIFSFIEMAVGAMMMAIAPNPVALMLLGAGLDGAMKAINPNSKGLMGELTKALGGSDEQAQSAEMGFGIGMAGVTLVASIAMLFIPGAEEGAVAGIMDAADSIASMVQTVTDTVQAAMSIGNAVVDTVDAGINYDATQKQADAQNEKAQAKRMEALIGQLDAMIDIAMSMLMNAQKGFNNMIDTAVDAMNDKGATLSHAKFAG